MDFPTFDKNATKPTQALTINATAAVNQATVEERVVAQQWRDVKNNGVGATHPLSLNRDAAQVTADPYTTP